jgi:hypothetical protein
MVSVNAASSLLLATILLLPWVSTSDCISQTNSLHKNSRDLLLSQKKLEEYVDHFCSHHIPSLICSWDNKTDNFSITYNYTHIKSNHNYTDFRYACNKAGGDFCEVSFITSVLNSTNYLDDDSFYDDDGYYKAGSTSKKFTAEFMSSPWCFAKGACDSIAMNTYIKNYAKKTYGGEVASFDLIGDVMYSN